MKDSFASVSAARWLTALAMMSGAAPALACPPGEDDSEGVELLRVAPGFQHQGQTLEVRGVPILHDLPLVTLGTHLDRGWGDEVQTNITMSHAVDGKTYEVQIKDGKTTAKIDGKELPDSQIRVSDDQVELLDADGNVVHTFPKGMKTTMRWKARINNDDVVSVPGFPATGRLRLATTQPAEIKAPPVMMGITMSEAADQNGLGVVVDKVMEGLPASKAGLRMGDKILEVNGREVEDVLSFREFLSERKAGEEITLKVLREGTPRDVKVTLEAFNEETLKPLIIELEGNAPKAITVTGTRENSAKKHIEAAMERLKAAQMSDEARKAAMETLTKALADMDAARAAPKAWNDDAIRLYTERGQQGGVFVAPRAGVNNAPRAEELDAKIELLNTRLEKALAMIENQQGKATPENLDKVKAQLLKLQKENEELRKKVEELQTKRGGN